MFSPLPQEYVTPIEQLTPVLTDPAFKLYFYLCTRSEATTGWVMVDESALTALRKDFEEVANLLKELEQQGICQLSDDELARPIAVQLLSPRHDGGPAASDTAEESLLSMDRELSAASQQHQLWPL